MPNEVTFIYHSGIINAPFTGGRLTGSWDREGHPSDRWTTQPMDVVRDDNGCTALTAKVNFPNDAVGKTFRWGVFLDGATGTDVWAIPTEVGRTDSSERVRAFTLRGAQQVEEYYLTYLRRLGANKLYAKGGHAAAQIRFSVWAPNARGVELVFGDPANGYIDDSGGGAISPPGAFAMQKDVATGIWSIDSRTHPELGDFSQCDHARAYMFKITRDDGSVKYRTDLYSRCQLGSGKTDPQGAAYRGRREHLDGTKSCSLVVDPERVMEQFDEPFPQKRWLREDEFWRDEISAEHPLPTRLEDLVIYELHVPGLAAGRPDPGSLKDAIDLLDHLMALGINAVELLPMAEYEGWAQWGYATSHYFAIEYVSGGRDQFKHFVRACHQRGIAVLLDVVYNHYTHDGERAEWAYDSPDPTRNIYYWYEGKPSDYPQFQSAVDPVHKDEGGYVDNDSTGWAPRYWEEPVRQLFISSAVALAWEFHVDGFRVDQTSCIHAYARLHADGRPADQARVFGAKFLREWTRTLRLVRPSIFLIAEDHSGWNAVTAPADQGGLGFDATWFADFYHHLVGDTGRGPEYGNVLRTAAYGDDRPLALDRFARALAQTSRSTVVYHESHDEAGNSHGDGWTSERTIRVAVNSAPLIGATRRSAEARCRLAATLALLSAGIPMFFMGEEVGCSKPYRYEDFMDNREDLVALRSGQGEKLFAYYQDLIRLRARHAALRGGGLDILCVHNTDRVLAFRRHNGSAQAIVVLSFANFPYSDSYELRGDNLPSGSWREVLNSDASRYGGSNVGNQGGTIRSADRRMRLALPAAGAVVLVSD